MRGIAFKADGYYENYLYTIFSQIDVTHYYWHVEFSENLPEGRLEEDVFDHVTMDGHEFRACIERSKYLMIHLDLKAFSRESDIQVIDDFDAYMSSPCVLALFCSDTFYYELYCKDQSLLHSVFENCKRAGFMDIEMIDAANDYRTRFHVF